MDADGDSPLDDSLPHELEPFERTEWPYTLSPQAQQWAVPSWKVLQVLGQPDSTALAVRAMILNPAGRLLMLQKKTLDGQPGALQMPGGECRNDESSIFDWLREFVWIDTRITVLGIREFVVGIPQPGRLVMWIVVQVPSLREPVPTLDPDRFACHLWLEP
ncbi:Uu.00g065470.m01.CDS01 [Anthostomella pinea]|uniref:Uu.00g065470.m01.CDS01 n=1 Tax=Anthostomella pinea TaxID=933095 RepID=A0AAI8YKS5_9PEZI|nr:Uu.00g065470.m01.CDS01 [Anthostomella pinea]